MTLRDYTANVISASKVVPDGAFQDSAASGVWDINAALDLIKGGNWPTTGNFNPAAFVDGLFQTHVYDGNGGTQSIVNNIDLSGSGGLVWTKRRDSSSNGDHTLYDTERGTGTGGRLRSNNDQQAYSPTDAVTAFNNNGFSIGADASINTNGAEYVSWTFRKQPKFFDVVTYTGNGSEGNTVNHNLGSVPGMILFKRRDATASWWVYHRGVDASAPEDYYLKLESTAARANSAGLTNDTAPTSTVITLGSNTAVNASGGSYVAYLFAHNNNDGGFGEPGDQDIIKCGSYTGNETNPNSINLGFEPQWLMVKAATKTQNWFIVDVIRGITTGGDEALLSPNLADADAGNNYFSVTPTGFNVENSGTFINETGQTYIYVAIRRGGMQTPTAASSVFAIDGETDTSPTPPTYNSGFPVDLFLGRRDVSSSGSWYVFDRLRGNTQGLITNTRDAEQNLGGAVYALDRNDGVGTYTGTSYPNAYGWMWKRARGYFDMVTWNVDGTGLQTINHNLGVAPEMIWSKNLDDSGSGSGDWWIGHTGLTGWDGANENDRHALKFTNAASVQQGYHKNLTATSMQLGGNAVGGYTTSHQGIAYLFATVAGVSKIGSYTGNGNDGRVIDCGFTSGASFVLIKRSDGTGNWMVFDSARGIVSGNDPFLKLNATSAETTTDDKLDPDNSGFIVNHSGASINNSGEEYIFYAIAATS